MALLDGRDASFLSELGAFSASQLSANDTLNNSMAESDVSNLSTKLSEWWHKQEAEWDRATFSRPRHSRAPSFDIQASGDTATVIQAFAEAGHAKGKAIPMDHDWSTASIDVSRSPGQSFDMDMSSEVAAVLHALAEAGHASGRLQPL